MAGTRENSGAELPFSEEQWRAENTHEPVMSWETASVGSIGAAKPTTFRIDVPSHEVYEISEALRTLLPKRQDNSSCGDGGLVRCSRQESLSYPKSKITQKKAVEDLQIFTGRRI